MRTESAVALKEWAAVCAALAAGRQSLLLRKGGIAEGAQGFRFEHDEFWLFPTQFHQSPEQLTTEGVEFLGRLQGAAPPVGQIPIELYGVVREVGFVVDEAQLEALAESHVMSPEVVRQRFHYKRPGLYVAAVEVFRRDVPIVIEDLPRFAGCHSWVDLESPIPTSGLSSITTRQTLNVAIDRVRSLAVFGHFAGNPDRPAAS